MGADLADSGCSTPFEGELQSLCNLDDVYQFSCVRKIPTDAVAHEPDSTRYLCEATIAVSEKQSRT